MFNATTTNDDNVRNVKKAQDNVIVAKENMREAAQRMGHTAREYFDTACDEVSHGTEVVTTQIRNNPVQSSVIALGIGFVLGALFRR